MMEPTDPDILILKHLAGTLTDEEAEALAAWRAEVPAHAERLAAVEKLWQAAAPAQTPIPGDVDAEWDRMRQRLRLDAPPKARILPLRRTWRFAAVAAVIVILVGVAFLLRPTTPPLHTLTAAPAETQTLPLPDGSTVHLNSGTTLRYPAVFEEDIRQVHLEGEAFFEVEAAGTPFVVISANARVQVLGTAFNVWARDAVTRVSVREGRVALEGLDGGSRLELTADEAAIRRGTAAPEVLSPAHAAAALAWLEDSLHFVQAPLSEILAELERAYDHPIRLDTPTLADATVTAPFPRSAPLDDILTSVCATLNCQHRLEDGTYVITQ